MLKNFVQLPSFTGTIFPDSKIAKEFSCARIKYVFLPTRFGFFLWEIISRCCKRVDNYELLFDESFDKIIDKGKMDPHICFCSLLENQVCTRYFISAVYGEGMSLHYSTNLFRIKRFRVLWLILQKSIFNWKRFWYNKPMFEAFKKEKDGLDTFSVNSWTRPV